MASSTKAARRRDLPVNHWPRHAKPVTLGDECFSFTMTHRNGTRESVDQLITQVDWQDARAELTGSASLADPDFNITTASRLRMRWSPSDRATFRRLWTMNVAAPNFSAGSGSWSLELNTNMAKIRKERDDFVFKVDKAHPRGWTADQIAEAVAKKIGMGVGKLSRCTHRIKNLTRKNIDPFDMIVLAYRQEKEATGRKFFVTWDGKLNIIPLRPSPYLIDLAGAIIDATYQRQLSDSLATALTVHTKAKQGKGRARKVKVEVKSAWGIKKYGYVHRTVTAPNAETEEDAIKFGRRLLRRVTEPKDSLEVTVPFMPGLRRGQAFRIKWRRLGVSQIVFVNSASHSVVATGGTTTVVASFEAPYEEVNETKATKQRGEVARRRGRKAANARDTAEAQRKAMQYKQANKARRRSDR